MTVDAAVGMTVGAAVGTAVVEAADEIAAVGTTGIAVGG